jgi:hypothetical protein
MTRGRPINLNSANQQKPWVALNMSRATFYWKKRYGDLPVISIFKTKWPDGLRNELRQLVRVNPYYKFLMATKGWSSSGITRVQIEWLIKEMGLTRKANRIAAGFVKSTDDFPDEGCSPPPCQFLEDLRAACLLYDDFNDQQKENFDAVVRQVLAKTAFSVAVLR